MAHALDREDVKRNTSPVRFGVALLLSLTTSLLLGLSQLVAWAGFVGLFAFVPMLFVCRTLPSIQAAALGALCGLVYGCVIGFWIPEALRGLGAGEGAAIAGLLAAAAWAKVGFFVGIALAASLVRPLPVWVQVVVVAGFVGLGEWILIDWRWGLPVGLIGQSQIDVQGVAQLAAVGGVPLVSAFVMAANQSIALAWRGGGAARRLAFSILMAWLGTAAVGTPLVQAFGAPESQGSALDALVVQPNQPHTKRWVRDLQDDHLAEVIDYTRESLQRRSSLPDLIVWPENVVTAYLDRDIELFDQLQAGVTSFGVPLIAGAVRSPTEEGSPLYRSSALWIDPQEGLLGGTDKELAIPILESGAPFPAGRWVSRMFGGATSWPKVEEVQGGSSLRGTFIVTPVLCYEVLFPGLVDRRTDPGSAVLLNLADDSWVEGEAATRWLTDLARWRAIEQRKPLVRVAHGGLSAAIGAYGEVIEELPTHVWAASWVTVRQRSPASSREKLSLVGLPIAIGVSVWWISSWIGFRREAEEG